MLDSPQPPRSSEPSDFESDRSREPAHPIPVAGGLRDGAAPAASAPIAPALSIVDGDVWAFYAFDIGHEVDIDHAQRIVESTGRDREAPRAATAGDGDERTSREEIRHRRRSASAPQFQPAPLRVDQPIVATGSTRAAAALQTTLVGGFSLAPRVECTIYDFGAISVAYRVPIGGGGATTPIEALIPITQAVMEQDTLREDALQRVRALVERITAAIDRPHVASIVEDYTVVHARRWVGARDTAMDDVQASAASIARVLIAEPGPLSRHAVEAATSASLSYSPGDAAVLDWNGALLLGSDEEDSITVLEFANVELLEMRLLDDRLDDALDRAYGSLLRRDRRGRLPRSPLALLFDPHRAERRWLAHLQMESAILFENANNTLKLVGDQHLARLYAVAARRLHIAEWDQSILRKLETVDGLYQKLADEQAARRMELLEWIIIILIAISIVLPFIPGVPY